VSFRLFQKRLTFSLLSILGCYTPAIAQTVVNSDGWVTMETASALNLFTGVCGGSLPSFENPTDTLLGLGFEQASSGTWFLPGRDASIKIKAVPNYGNTCSLVFGSAEDIDIILAAFSEVFPTMQKTEVGNVGRFGEQNASVILHNGAKQRGSILYLHVEMLPIRN
jgi:hypothetical protein